MRKSWTQEEWLLRNTLLRENLFSYLRNLPQGSILLSFQSIPNKREVDTKPIHETLLLPPFDFQLAFPRVEGDGIMSAYLVNDKTQWETSTWHIQEPDPTSSTKISPVDIAIILVPLIGFDEHGHRVGFGKGFYDRFLAQCQPDCLKIGLSLEEAVPKIDDLHGHDIPMDIIVSSERLYTIH